MIDIQKQEKIKRFLADKVMQEAVFEVLQSSFLKKRAGADVHILASQTLANEALIEGWRELEKNKVSATSEIKKLQQVGL